VLPRSLWPYETGIATQAPTRPDAPTSPAAQVPTLTPTATPTHEPISIPTQGLNATPTLVTNPIPIPTSPPTPTPSPTPSPTPKLSETVTARFVKGPAAVQTQYSYSGTVTVTISGTGQAASTKRSDAFYIYTDPSGKRITPWHGTRYPNWTLCINRKVSNAFVSSPPYNAAHTYTFTMKAPGGHITFGVCDGNPSDNTGFYTITITEGGPASSSLSSGG
jgi:hypothetical protein